MAPEAQTVNGSNIINCGYSEKDAIRALYAELEKGIQSIRNGEVYTVEEAWEDIDKI